MSHPSLKVKDNFCHPPVYHSFLLPYLDTKYIDYSSTVLLTFIPFVTFSTVIQIFYFM